MTFRQRQFRRIIRELERSGLVRVYPDDQDEPWAERRLELTDLGRQFPEWVDALLDRHDMRAVRTPPTSCGALIRQATRSKGQRHDAR